MPEGRTVLARQEVAAAFGVSDKTLESTVTRHRAELHEHGLQRLTDKASGKIFKVEKFFPARGPQVLDVFPPTAVTIVGMLLTESDSPGYELS